MNNCTVCDDSFRNGNPNKVICDGICRQSFHAECVNFSKDSLLCYREMPNLQWLCDGCIIQIRSSNVSFPPLNKFNSTVVIPTSSPSYIERSLIPAKRNRNAKQKNGSVFLVNRSTNVVQDSSNDTLNEIQSEGSVKPPGANGLNSPITTVAIQSIQSVCAQSKSPHNTAEFKETRKEPLELENPPENSTSFADVLTKSPIDEPVPGEVKNPTIQPRNDLFKSPFIGSPSSVTHKVVYVSKFHPSVTEKEVVDYLLSKDIITSADDVSCKILVSPNVNMDSVSFVSFKITVNSKIFHSVVNGKLWPDGVIVREFVKR